MLILTEIKDSKDHWYEVEFFKEKVHFLTGKECNSFQEVLDFINILDKEEVINYCDLTLDFNNKKTKNVKDLGDLTSLISENRLKIPSKQSSETN